MLTERQKLILEMWALIDKFDEQRRQYPSRVILPLKLNRLYDQIGYLRYIINHTQIKTIGM